MCLQPLDLLLLLVGAIDSTLVHPSTSALHATLESPTVTIQFSALDATNGSISSLQIDPHTRMTARNGPVAVL